ncbi:MAG TPA: methylated-DNA--[protein]-cysteine S-methyltransferase [Planctomycetota bacterium]|nr:methylated-DNA--[protein]-cysteine S-methyltransferase [Planctomycetota bacterium]
MKTEVRSHTLFDSKIGALGVAWSERGLIGVQLPEKTRAKTAARIAARAGSKPGEAPAWVAAAVEEMRALVAGGAADLDHVPLDVADVPKFHGRVYAALRKLRAGETCTYAELAAKAGSPAAARAVGQAMRRNPWPLVVPCHRVLAAGDRLGGFSAAGGIELKARLLRAESAPAAKLLATPKSRTIVARATKTARRAPKSLGFDAELALSHLRQSDAQLAALIDRVPFSLELSPYTSTFEALLRTIVYQQLNGKAASTIHGRVVELLPGKRIDPRALLAIEETALRGAGLSRAKVAAARDLAQRSVAGEIPDREELAAMSDEEVVERLTVVRGIGRWSVEMLLMFWLGRPDVLPVGDFGVKNGFMVLMKRRAMPTERALELHARRWRPFRSVASWYMWRAVDEARAAKLPAAR